MLYLDQHLLLSGVQPKGIMTFLQQVQSEQWPESHPRNPYSIQSDGKEIYEILRTWYDGYYHKIEAKVTAGLWMQKQRADQIIDQYPPVQAVEQVTNGIYLEDMKSRTVIVTPHYHWRPIVLYKDYEDVSYYAYSADDLVLFRETIPPII
ncbi:transcriptional regulator, ArsR family [Geomicrobium sp. JCM 19039]|nr:transcriptional regulator, ArsR family [Geomicrobium sp. JCM 19039]